MSSREVLAVAYNKQGKRYCKLIKREDKMKVREQCIKNGWSIPTFYDPKYTTFKDDREV